MRTLIFFLLFATAVHGQTAMCDMQKSGSHDLSVPKGQAVFVCRIDLKNHGSGFVNAIQIIIDGDMVDNSSGISIANDGRADALYIGVNGKRGAASSPTGLAVDVNRNGNQENSPQNSGIGVQVWDWSKADQGAVGPKGFYYQKVNNLNSDHIPIHIRSNSQAVLIETPEGAGYKSDKNVIVVQNDLPQQKFRVTANGDVYATSLHVSNSTQVQYVGEIVTTNQAVDNLPVSGLTQNSHCLAQPESGTVKYWAEAELNGVRLHHAAIAGAKFALFCSLN